jgi:adenosylcobinamide-GDP ribazoletransferase
MKKNRKTDGSTPGKPVKPDILGNPGRPARSRNPGVPVLAGLREAMSFLTVIPSHTGEQLRLGRAIRYFPVVGVVIGVITATAAMVSVLVFPSPVAAVLTVTVWVMITGALHLDGFTDTLDAVCAPRSPEERLSIMKDVAVGSFGAVGLILLIFLKITLVSTLLGFGYDGFGYAGIVLTLTAAAVVGRAAMILVILVFPAAGTGGLGAQIKTGSSGGMILASLAVPLVVLVGIGGVLVYADTAGAAGMGILAGTALSLLVSLAVGKWFSSRLPGLTGDTYGAICEIAETAYLTGAILAYGWSV